MQSQRTNIRCNEWVREMLERAVERYYKKYERYNVTSEFLLFIMIEETTTLISQYMYNEGLFSCYIDKSELENCIFEEDEEDYCSMILLARIEAGIDILETEEYTKGDRNSMTTTIQEVFLSAKEIAKRIGKDLVDEEVLTIAIVQCNNPIWEMLDVYDVEDIANGKILAYFSEDNYTSEGFLEEPIDCEYGYN